MDYNCVVTFIKHTNLLEYFDSNIESCAAAHCLDIHSVGAMEHLRQMYAEEREVRLVVLVRYDGHGKTFCRIKCPINPLPVKGEFEVPSLRTLHTFLMMQGWVERECLHRNMLI